MRVGTMRDGLAALQASRDAAKAIAVTVKKRPKPRPVKLPKGKRGER